MVVTRGSLRCLVAGVLVSAPSTNDTPTSATPQGRLHLLEWSVLMQREELARAKRLFLRDLTDLQVHRV